MQYKRILMSCLIVILILCTSVLGIGATDEVAPLKLAVEVTSSTAVSEEPYALQPGDSFEVSISIDSNPGILAFYFKLEYDSEALTLLKKDDAIDYVAGDIVPENKLVVYEADENTVKVTNNFGINEVTANGTIVTFKFKVNEDTHGTAPIKFTLTQLMTKSYDMLDHVVEANTEAIHIHTVTGDPVVTGATCTEPATKKYTCSECNEELVIADGEALGHDFSTEWTVDKAATCLTPGSKSHHCTRCDEVADVTEISVGDHAYGEWKVVTAATCTETGSEKRTCSVCQNAETRTIEATGHTEVAYEDVEATKDAVGYTGGTYCSVCNTTLTERTEIPQLKSNAWIYILIAIVVIVAIGGGVCAYFFIIKKKKVAPAAAEEVSVSKTFSENKPNDAE